jgi:hypothetical protein
MKQLPRSARVYVVAVIVIGLALMALKLPEATFAQPLLFIALLLLSSITAALKVHLPLTTSGSTMSVSYAVDFASLLLLGPHETMLVAAGSAFSQCHLNSKDRNPIHRTLFSVASLVITVQASGLAFHLLGGTGANMTISELARPLVGAATAYFLLNTGLVATAIALSTRTPILSAPGTTTSCGARRATSSAPAPRRSPPGSSPCRLLGGAAHLRAALSDLSAPTRSTWAGSKTSSGTCCRPRTSPRRRSRRWRARSTPRIRRRRCTSGAVQVYAGRPREGLGLTDAEIQGVKTAALLHDIGKLAVPEHILSKPGR